VTYAGVETGVSAALLKPGTVSASVGAAATHRVVLHLSEDAYNGDAQFAVRVDGKAVGGGTVTASRAAGQVQDFAYDVAAKPVSSRCSS
jgi:hypothetical protein